MSRARSYATNTHAIDNRMSLKLKFKFWPGESGYPDKRKCREFAARKPRSQGFANDGSFLSFVRHDVDDE